MIVKVFINSRSWRRHDRLSLEILMQALVVYMDILRSALWLRSWWKYNRLLIWGYLSRWLLLMKMLLVRVVRILSHTQCIKSGGSLSTLIVQFLIVYSWMMRESWMSRRYISAYLLPIDCRNCEIAIPPWSWRPYLRKMIFSFSWRTLWHLSLIIEVVKVSIKPTAIARV